jgi:hypothetical protein
VKLQQLCSLVFTRKQVQYDYCITFGAWTPRRRLLVHKEANTPSFKVSISLFLLHYKTFFLSSSFCCFWNNIHGLYVDAFELVCGPWNLSRLCSSWSIISSLCVLTFEPRCTQLSLSKVCIFASRRTAYLHHPRLTKIVSEIKEA